MYFYSVLLFCVMSIELWDTVVVQSLNALCIGLVHGEILQSQLSRAVGNHFQGRANGHWSSLVMGWESATHNGRALVYTEGMMHQRSIIPMKVKCRKTQLISNSQLHTQFSNYNPDNRSMIRYEPMNQATRIENGPSQNPSLKSVFIHLTFHPNTFQTPRKKSPPPN